MQFLFNEMSKVQPEAQGELQKSIGLFKNFFAEATPLLDKAVNMAV